MWNFDPKVLNSETRLDNSILKNQSSVRFYQFIAAIESNFNIKIEKIGEIIIFGDLLKKLNV